MSDDSRSRRHEQPGFGGFVLRVAERFGVPVAILAAVFFGIYVSASWLANNMVTPLVNRHMKFLDVSEENQKAMLKTQEALSDGMHEFRDGQIETQTLIRTMTEWQRRSTEEQRKTNAILQAPRGTAEAEESTKGGP